MFSYDAARDNTPNINFGFAICKALEAAGLERERALTLAPTSRNVCLPTT